MIRWYKITFLWEILSLIFYALLYVCILWWQIDDVLGAVDWHGIPACAIIMHLWYHKLKSNDFTFPASCCGLNHMIIVLYSFFIKWWVLLMVWGYNYCYPLICGYVFTNMSAIVVKMLNKRNISFHIVQMAIFCEMKHLIVTIEFWSLVKPIVWKPRKDDSFILFCKCFSSLFSF